MKKPKSGVPGVEWMNWGWRFSTRIGGAKGPLERESVSDPKHLIDRQELKDAIADFKHRMRKEAGVYPADTVRGTFEDDVVKNYMPLFTSNPREYYNDRYRVMRLWIAEFGKMPSAKITTNAIEKVRERWLTIGPKIIQVPWDEDHPRPKGCKHGRMIEVAGPLSKYQVRNRLTRLQNFFTKLYPGRHPNPVTAALPTKMKKRVIRSRSFDVVGDILAEMNTGRGRAERGQSRPTQSLSHLRATFMSYSGIPHATLKKITKDDLHLNDPEGPWFMKRGRDKGEGTDDKPMPLDPKAAEALQALADAGGLGNFSNSGVWKAMNRAVKRHRESGGEISGHIRPYDVTRHSFITAVASEAGLEKAGMLADHEDPRTTSIYGHAAEFGIRRRAIQQASKAGVFKGKKEGKQKKGEFTTVGSRPAPAPRLVKNPSQPKHKRPS